MISIVFEIGRRPCSFKPGVCTFGGAAYTSGRREGGWMSDFGEALGTASEGGMFARVFRHKRGEPSPAGDDRPRHCRNCSAELAGPYCHVCGQKGHVHRTIGAILHDIVHGVLHLDGKLWRTLPLLTFRPGRLTREYIEGKRARFVSPMAMFLFSVFAMFAIFQALGFTTPTDFGSRETLQANLKSAHENAVSQRSALAEQLAAMPAASSERVEIETDLEELDKNIGQLEVANSALIGGDDEGTIELNVTGIEFLDEGILKKWRDNPSLMLYKLQANSYKFSWLLIPLSIPFVWLLFVWRRQFKAYDHAIFVTYSLSFMSLLFITLSMLGILGVPLQALLAAGSIIPPIHIYKQLRGTYALRRFSAIWRLAALMVFINIVIVLFLQLLLVLGAF
jgi:hypothetical protein